MKDTAPVLLAIETGTSTCSVALFKSRSDYAIVSRDGFRRHNENLPEMVEEALDRQNVDRKDIDAIAVSIGPGSFAGLRVGLSFAKGFALGVGAVVVPVNTLDGLALSMRWLIEGVSDVHSSVNLRICPLTVARRGESFGRIYSLTNDGVMPENEIFLKGAEFIDEIGSRLLLLGGEGFDSLRDDIKEHYEVLTVEELKSAQSVINKYNRIVYIRDLKASAAAVGTIGMQKFEKESDLLPAAHTLEPLYLKEFTVRMSKNF